MTLAVAVVTVGAPSAATAATLLPSGLQTGMAIDGTTTPASPPNTFNWGNFLTGIQPDSSFTFVPTGPYTTTQGFASTGVFKGAFDWDNGTANAACNVGAEPTGAPPSQSPNTNPWLPGTAKPNGKGDLCSTGYGFESIVDAGGTRHAILYGYWTRYDGAGEVSIFQHLEGPGPGRCDDVLLEFDYAAGGTTARVLRWVPRAGDACANTVGPGTWIAQPGSVNFDWSTGIRTEGPPLTNQPGETFGEFAIDLSTAGIIAPTACTDFTVSEMFTRTGNSPQANIQDFARHTPTPLTFSNCGAISVTKVTDPAGVQVDDGFGITISRDSGPVVPGPPPVDTVVDTLRAGETKTYTGILASDDEHLFETQIPPPWSLDSVICTATPLSGGPPVAYDVTDPADTFPVSPENTTSCVITNTAAVVTVVKQTMPDNSPGSFDFTVSGEDPFSLSDGASKSFAVPVGQPVTIAEAIQSGWLPPNVTCDAPAQIGSGAATVTPAAGDNITCTFTNTALGTVIISKEAHGVNGRTFDFTSDLPGGTAFSIAVPNGDGTLYEQVFTDVPPGSYVVNETTDTADPATRLADLSCTYGGSDHTGDAASRSIGLTVLPGETVRCFFTNSLPGSLAVIKRTLPVEYDQDFDFLLTPPTGPASPFTLNGNSTPPNIALASFLGLDAGSYTISEPADVPGWTFDGVECNGVQWQPSADGRGADIDLLDTDAGVCFFTNRAAPASLSVQKNVAGIGPRLAWAFALELVAPDGTVITRTATDTASLAQWADLVPGQVYTIREASPAPPGWTPGTLTCTGVADLDPGTPGVQFMPGAGQAVSCDVLNTAQTSAISVAKVAGGIGVGYDWSFDLSIAPVPAGETGTKTVTGTGQSGATVQWSGLVPGVDYTITEDASGWNGSVDCTGAADEDAAPGLQFTAPIDATVSCTFTNLALPGTGTLTKTSLGGDGTFEFVLNDLDEGIDPVIVTATTVGGVTTIPLPPIVPGVRYSFQETDHPDWIEGPLTCTITPGDGSAPFLLDDLSDFSVNPGDVGDCTATNAAYGRIVVVKAVDGDDGSFDFTGDWKSPPEFSITTTDGSGAASFEDVVPGSYTVEELAQDGYGTTELTCVDSDQTGASSTVDDLVGSIELDPGETVTCTFSNVQWGVIVVDKVTSPAGSAQEFGFEWGPAGDASESFTLTDGAPPFSTAPLEPGDYQVSELAVDGWQLDGAECIGASGGAPVEGATAVIGLGLGDTVVCTFTNRQIEPPVPPIPPVPPVPPDIPDTLTPTGVDATLPVIVAVALLVGGAVVLAFGRRRARRRAGAGSAAS